MTFEEAAAVPQASLTAWQSLIRFGKLHSDDKVLIIGASGGVGSYAVQIARALGASVTGVCSTRNIELVRNLGAEQISDYTKEKFNDILSDFDIVYDTVGNETQASCRSVLNSKGRFLSTLPRLRIGIDWLVSNSRNAFSPHSQASTKLFLLTWPRGSDLQQIAQLIAQGQIRSVVDKTFPLEKALEAQSYSRQGRTQGKIILTMRK